MKSKKCQITSDYMKKCNRLQMWDIDESHATTTLRTLIVVSNKVIWQMLSMETKIFLPFVTP